MSFAKRRPGRANGLALALACSVAWLGCTESDSPESSSIAPGFVTLPNVAEALPEAYPLGHTCWPRLGDGPDAEWAPTLAETGCYDFSGAVPEIVAGAIPYTVRVPLWSDLATKGRYLLLPEGATMSWSETEAFGFPAGTVIVKEFLLDGQLLESRFVLLEGERWQAVTYRWNDTLTDASVVLDGETITVGDATWYLPGEEDCVLCHTRVSGFVLGLRGDQLFTSFPVFGGEAVNQVAAYDAMGWFDAPLPDPLPLVPLAALDDPDASLEHRARSYLDSNCASCHQPGGAPHSDIDLRITTPLADTDACDVYPLSGDLGLRAAARIITPGDPASSVLSLRMDRRDDDAMPQLSTFLVHDEAVDVVEAWIASLEGCD